MKDKKKHICSMCKKETTWDGNAFRPFCSERCRLMDLGKWASGDYRIPGERKDLAEEEEGEKNPTEE